MSAKLGKVTSKSGNYFIGEVSVRENGNVIVMWSNTDYIDNTIILLPKQVGKIEYYDDTVISIHSMQQNNRFISSINTSKSSTEVVNKLKKQVEVLKNTVDFLSHELEIERGF